MINITSLFSFKSIFKFISHAKYSYSFAATTDNQTVVKPIFKRNYENHKVLPSIDHKPEIIQFINTIYDLKLSREELTNRNDQLIKQLSENASDKALKDQQNNLKTFYEYVQKIILETEMSHMEEMAKYYLTKQGKLVRPALNLLLAQLQYERKNPDIPFLQSNNISAQKIWAGVIELLHISSLIHDDIIDNAKSRRGLSTAHLKYGKRNATFSANYIIGRSGRKIAELNNLHMFQIYSEIMQDLTSGEYIQASQNKNFKKLLSVLNDYIFKTYYKTASLMAHSARGVCVLNGESQENQEICFKFGQNLGISFQLIDDVLDFTSDAASLGKQNLADLKEGNITGPVLFAIHELQGNAGYDQLLKIIQQKNMTDQEVEQASILIRKTNGIEKTIYMALLHAQKALEYIDKLNPNKSSNAYQGLKSLNLSVIKRKK